MLGVVYILIPFLVFAINAFLAALVARGEWRSRRRWVFTAFLAAMALWGLTIFGMRSSPTLEVAFVWERWVFVAITLASVTFYHFCLEFTDARYGRARVGLLYGSVGVVGVLSGLGLIAPEMQRKFYGYAPVLGPGFPVYLVISYAPIALAFQVLRRRAKGLSDAEERTRLTYVMVGAAMSVAGATTDFLAPLGLRVYPMGVVMNIGFGVVTTIAVTRFHLFELRFLLRRGLSYAVVSALVFGMYGALQVAFMILFRNQTTLASILATVAALVLAMVSLPPIVGRIQGWVDRMFYRERYDHLRALEEFTAATRDIADFAGLAEALASSIRLGFQADWAMVLIPDREERVFSPAGGVTDHAPADLHVGSQSWVAAWLQGHEAALTPVVMAYDPYLQSMAEAERLALLRSGFQVIVPLKAKGRLTGMLALGGRLVEEPYTAADIRTLMTFGAQAATLIQNARLYDQERARLLELERLAGLKSNLLRTVSHELKSPITAVKTAVDLLALTSNDVSGQTRARLMRTLQNGIDRLERLVAESLDYAKLRSAELEVHRQRASMAWLIDVSAAMVGPSMTAKNQRLTVAVEPLLPDLLVDAQQIERVLVNLLSNATKFTPPGGTIGVHAYRSGDNIATDVKDTGRGIPAQDQANIFGEYFRGANADAAPGSGTGLGLAIARSLAQLHGGDITFVSQEGVGSTFTLTLPVGAPAAEDTPASVLAPTGSAEP